TNLLAALSRLSAVAENELRQQRIAEQQAERCDEHAGREVGQPPDRHVAEPVQVDDRIDDGPGAPQAGYEAEPPLVRYHQFDIRLRVRMSRDDARSSRQGAEREQNQPSYKTRHWIPLFLDNILRHIAVTFRDGLRPSPPHHDRETDRRAFFFTPAAVN